MATLTKEQLKNELISHGIQPPVQSARKEEFVKLYEQHVAPIVSQKGDFSSDEETEVVIEEKVEVSNNSLVFNGLDITTISDDDLYSQLQSFGIPVGPIVDTTRSVYQRKLAALLQNGTATPAPEDTEVEQTNGNGASQEEKYSDSEEEEQQEQNEEEHHIETIVETFIQPSAPAPMATDSVISNPEPLTAIRKRVTERPPSSLSALPLVDRQGTPTPRPSIRSFTGSSQYTYESRRLVDATDGSAVKPLSSHVGSSPVLCFCFLLDVTDNILNDINACGLTMKIRSKYVVFIYGLSYSTSNQLGMVIKSKMVEKINRSVQHCNWICNILSGNGFSGISSARLKHSILRTHVSSTQEAWATNKTACEIRKNITIKVGHDHNIKLLRFGHHLHTTVINNHIVMFYCVQTLNLLTLVIEMVKVCAILGCKNQTGEGFSFFSVPKIIPKDKESEQELQKKRRSLWIKQLKNKTGVTDHINSRVCNEHFITGTPNKDDSHPDWVPNVNLCSAATPINKDDAKNVLQRYLRRSYRNQVNTKGQQSLIHSEEIVVTPLLASYSEDSSETLSTVLLNHEEQTAEYGDDMDLETASTHSKNGPVDEVIKKLQEELQTTALQRDSALKEVEKLGDMIAKVSLEKLSVCEKLHELQLQGQKKSSFINELENDDTKTLYYTGLNSFKLLTTIFNALLPALHQDPRFKVSLKEQFIITLMKLRLNLGIQDLGYRFGVSKKTVSSYIEKFINVMYVRLPPALLLWPDQEALMKTMPNSFRVHYPKCVAIIDAFEIFCEMHSNIIDKSSCYSNYKSHHTVKFVIGMTPQGSINFVSKGFGGRSTDVDIVNESGFLDNIAKNDEVMADKGFLIEEAISSRGATLVMPAFKGRRQQLEGSETERSRIISNERIHIERGIGNLRKKFTILRGPIKVEHMCSDPSNYAFIDKVVIVCCCLMNSMPSIVPPW